jgi:hypothetical protein
MAAQPSALMPPKKPKADHPDFADARRACRTPAEREQLALVQRAQWTSAELQEFTRLYYFKNGRDYPTPSSYRRAIADLARHYHLMPYTDAKPSQCTHEWLKAFRKGGSKIMPPRREGLLIRGRGLTHKINHEEYSWPGHTEETRSYIEQRCRDYFKITLDRPVHVNAWAASYQADQRELRVEADKERKVAEAARAAREAVTLVLSPKAKRRSPTRAEREDRAAFEYCEWGRRGYNPVPFTRETQAQLLAGLLEPAPPLELIGKLKPHFSYHFKGHTPAFREEVAALARKDLKLRHNAFISPTRWKAACYKHFILIERHQA